MSSTWLDDDEWTGGPKRAADRTPTAQLAAPTAPAPGQTGRTPTGEANRPSNGRARDGGAWEATPEGYGRWQAPGQAPAGPLPGRPAAPGMPGQQIPTAPLWQAPEGTADLGDSTGATRPEEEHPSPPLSGPDHRGSDTRRRGATVRQVLAASLVAALVAAGLTVPLTLRLADAGEETAAATTTQTIALPAEEDASAPQQEEDETPVAPAAPAAEITSDTVANVAEQVLPSVAVVETAVNGRQVGSGSAVVFRQDGYLVTNNHVIDQADQVRVRLFDGRVLEADVVGTAADFDLAVLQVTADDLVVPGYADAEPRVGETAIAIGAPFGFNSTVTSGIVSATGRTLSDPATQTSLVDLVQTDAAINPGNSGGALVNASGQVIGLNTAIVGGGTNDGIGFAVPTSSVVRVGDQLIEQGFFEYAQLGVGQIPGGVTPEIAESRGLDTTNGALVGDVNPQSAADVAGIVTGDIVVAIAGEEISSFDDLAASIRGMNPGDQIELEVIGEDGESRTVEVTLGGVRTND
ncbi:trypsin-like peptidase domain-containing protein [Euzebya tangerina]|uniref:trypsin-like peptidase domain-containing protein n=1 Tax=Euzebya tangerina TaxID=591198 RepID=UPI000E30E32F|nr:trypsin-like peptidase domain-containing protein [Euzebya tangerina]